MSIQTTETKMKRQMIDEANDFHYDFKNKYKMTKAIIYALYRTGHCEIVIQRKYDQHPISYEFQNYEDGSLHVTWKRLGTLEEGESENPSAIADIITAIDFKKTGFELRYSSSKDDKPDIKRIHELIELLYQGYAIFDEENGDSYNKTGSRIRQWIFLSDYTKESQFIRNTMRTNNNVPMLATYQEAVKRVQTKMDDFYDKVESAYQLYRMEVPPDWDLIDAMLETGVGFEDAHKTAATHNARKFQKHSEPTER